MRFEYRFVKIGEPIMDRPADQEDILERLNALGGEGWQLVPSGAPADWGSLFMREVRA